jgi:hypothetical protein
MESKVTVNQALANKMDADAGGGGAANLNYTVLLMLQVNQIRHSFVQAASTGFHPNSLEVVEASIQTLHTLTQAYHYKDYTAAYVKAMGELKLLDLRDRQQRRKYYDWLQAWFGALIYQLKRMGILIERSGILDFE